MLFNSFDFFEFLPIALISIFLTKGRLQKLILLVLSYFFYAYWNVSYLPLLLASTFVDYRVGMALKNQQIQSRRRVLIGISLCFNLGLLFLCKYLNLVVHSLNALGLFHLDFSYDGQVPVGISFYSFQTLAYAIDVYRRQMEPVEDPLTFALYVCYFPQLVAGPIERAQELIPRLVPNIVLNSDRFVEGSKRIIWGLFEKCCLGDRLGTMVDLVYQKPDGYSAGDLLLGTVAFYGQVYWDFCGYCDVALGVSTILGIGLMENFKRPYIAKSISDFWSRWHISLSSWFRDYVYIPLGGNRVPPWRWAFNVAAVFLLSGLWHGSSWTYLVWGGLHAIYYFIERLWNRRPMPAWLARCFTFAGVTLAWVFFRASTVDQAFEIVGRIFSMAPGVLHLTIDDTASITILLAAFALLFEHYTIFDDRRDYLSKAPRWVRVACFGFFLVAIALWGVSDNKAFIYFQF